MGDAEEKGLRSLHRGPLLHSGLHPAWGSLWHWLRTTGRVGNGAQEGCLSGSVAQRGCHQNCPEDQTPGSLSQMMCHLRAPPSQSPAQAESSPSRGPSVSGGLGNAITGLKGAESLPNLHLNYGQFCPLDTVGTDPWGVLGLWPQTLVCSRASVGT